MNVVDRRRLLGPPNAVPLKFESAKDQDGEQTVEGTRELFIKRGTVATSNGSAYLESDGLIVQAIVYGPRPVSVQTAANNMSSSELMTRATFSVRCELSPLATSTDGTQLDINKISLSVRDVFLSSLMLEKYPKSTIDVHLQCLALPARVDDGTVLALATNCVSIALVDSGLEMRDMPVSVSRNDIVLTMLNYQSEIAGILVNRNFNKEELQNILTELEEETRGVRKVINDFLIGSD